ITPGRGDKYTFHQTDQGLIKGDSATGEVGLATLPTAPPNSTGKPGTQFDSGTPRVPGTASQSPQGITASMPLRPANFSTPKGTIRSSRDTSGTETDNIFDTNPNSKTFGKKIGSTGNTRAPLPDRTQDRNNQKNDLTSTVETYASEALKRNGNDPDKAI